MLCIVAETAAVAVAFAVAVTIAVKASDGATREEKSNIWCVGVGIRNGFPGAEIVRKILDQEKKFKYLRRTPSIEGKVLVLKLNKVSREVGAGYATCAIWLGPENNDDESYQESQGWDPTIMDRYAHYRPYRAYPIQKVVTFDPVQVCMPLFN